jgi:hypothetical protein
MRLFGLSKTELKGKGKFKMTDVNIDICKNWGADLDILMWFFDLYSFPVCQLGFVGFAGCCWLYGLLVLAEAFW